VSFSPDGNKIVVGHRLAGIDGDIYTMNVDGTLSAVTNTMRRERRTGARQSLAVR
jgi:hypothetical protein